VAGEDSDAGLLPADVPLLGVDALAIQLAPPRPEQRPGSALAPLAATTDSGMSAGPRKAPLTNTPGRVVSMGFAGSVRQKP
jgi:hypothetical protein